MSVDLEYDRGDVLLGGGSDAAPPPPRGELSLVWPCSDAAWRHGRLHCTAARLDLCSSLLLVLAGLFALLATVGHDAASDLVKAGVVKHVMLDSPDAHKFASFTDSADVDAGKMVATYWFFNCTNFRDVARRGAKPHLELVGPLRYRYVYQRFNLTWDEQAVTVSYSQLQQYFPADDATALLQEAEVVTADLVLMAALNRNQPNGEADLIPIAYPSTLAPESLFIRTSMRNLLFGFQHPLLPARFPGIQANDSDAAAAARQHSPSRVATGRFSQGQMMQFVEFDGGASTRCCRGGLEGETGAMASGNCGPAFGTYEADAVRGSFGAQFHPFVDAGETLRLATFDFGMLRSWPMTCGHVGQGLGPGLLADASDLTARIGSCESYDLQGVRLNKHILPASVLGNASVSTSESAAFGITGPSGLLNQTSCEQLAPVFISRPFFLGASEGVRQALENVAEGDYERYGSFLGVEPVTGTVLDLAMRMQVNARLTPMTVFPFGAATTYFPELLNTTAPFGLYLPVAWGEQRAFMTGNQNLAFTQTLYTALGLLAFLRWGGAALALASLAAGFVLKYGAVARFRDVEAIEGGGRSYAGSLN